MLNWIVWNRTVFAFHSAIEWVLYTTRIHKQTTQYKYNSGGQCCSGTNGFINSFTSAHSDTKRERDTILTFLTPTNARRVLWCLKSLSVEIRKSQLFDPMAESPTLFPKPPQMAETQLSDSMVQSQLTTDPFSKILKFSAHLFRAWRHPHSSTISCLEVGLLWQSPLSYPLPASVNCTNWLYTWTLYPNSSKPNKTEW